MTNEINKGFRLSEILLVDPELLNQRTVSTEEILHLMKPVTAFRVVEEFDDDHVACFRTEITVDDETYLYEFMWIGESCRRMMYQSEISQVIRDSRMKVWLAEQIQDTQNV